LSKKEIDKPLEVCPGQNITGRFYINWVWRSYLLLQFFSRKVYSKKNW